MSRDRVPVGVAVLGFVVAGVAAFTLPGPPVPTGKSAVQALLDAWKRSRESTYLVASTYSRRLDSGAGISSKSTIVQRPPDRLSYGLGEASGRINGRIVTCGSAPDGRYGCITGVRATSYEAEVTKEVNNLRSQLVGDPTLYQVTRDGPECYDLTQTGSYPILPYGRSARLCFDSATGAPILAEIHRDGLTEVTRAVLVRAKVTDADFRVPPPAGGLPQPDG